MKLLDVPRPFSSHKYTNTCLREHACILYMHMYAYIHASSHLHIHTYMYVCVCMSGCIYKYTQHENGMTLNCKSERALAQTLSLRI